MINIAFLCAASSLAMDQPVSRQMIAPVTVLCNDNLIKMGRLNMQSDKICNISKIFDNVRPGECLNVLQFYEIHSDYLNI